MVNSYILQTVGFSFANDVAIDAAGNAYVTDTFGAKIWKVSTTGIISIFANDTRWISSPALSVNGIEILNGVLYTMVYSGNSSLYAVSLTSGVATAIPISGPIVTSADGIFFLPSGDLVVSSNLRVAYLIKSTNYWASASVAATFSSNVGAPYATTGATYANGNTYVLQGSFANVPPAMYYIEPVTWTYSPTTAATPTSAAGTASEAGTANTIQGSATGLKMIASLAITIMFFCL